MIHALPRPTPLDRLRSFALDDCGAVTVDYVFMTSAVAAVGIAVLQTLSQGVSVTTTDIAAQLTEADIIFASLNFGRDRATVLAEGELFFYTPAQILSRFALFSDPAERTDTQVRNQHRTWVRRIDDPEWTNQGQARDMVRMLEFALEVRELEPHSDI